ncbi:hypothetical protein [Flavilitoribacter nigricans]|uniref:Uncharacterized protein n=1 Tax=Flavilitoribacter nigricans (strain ATCC 23147 / DSM 23189 / NBRC 102662 / NCIMB 1420 / SS-2) TaxID=1122177 RepID=A0A2D0NJT3_FLAN2|nr:hypothetical protein [Flavilitoribacter nigricans]PHN07993.1 hypothetical protein CRP01_04355 [Flavilitoribacter nigricans DSM 23189 = NBRC 102662]
MINYQFEKNARRNRIKALFFTIAFHAILLGGIFMTGDAGIEEYIPDVVQEWIGMDSQDEAVAKLPEDKQVIRP